MAAPLFALLLGKRDLHSMRWGYLEALQRLFGRITLQFGGELDEGDIVPVRHQTHLLEARELIEQHRQHHFIGLLGQIGKEEDLIRRLLGLCICV